MPSTTYDFPTTQINGQLLTVDRLANSPLLIYRMLRTVIQQRLVGDRALAGRVNLTGTGSGVYEIGEQIFPDFLPVVVPPLDEYPLTTDTPGTIAEVHPLKWGQGFEISDRMIAHNRMDIMMRRLTKVANRLIFNSDAITLSAIASAVTQTQAATNGVWGTTGSTVFADVMLAAAQVDSLNQGYVPDTVLLSPTKYAQAISSPNVLGAMPREDRQNITATGNMVTIAGMQWWKTTNLPPGVLGMVFDSTALGSQAYEDLGGGYTGTPGQVESQVIPLPLKDGKWVQARIVKAFMV
jgi:hypothetical protein